MSNDIKELMTLRDSAQSLVDHLTKQIEELSLNRSLIEPKQPEQEPISVGDLVKYNGKLGSVNYVDGNQIHASFKDGYIRVGDNNVFDRIGPTLQTGRDVLIKALHKTMWGEDCAYPLHGVPELPTSGNIMKPIVPGENLLSILTCFRWRQFSREKIDVFKHYKSVIDSMPEHQQIVDYWA